MIEYLLLSLIQMSHLQIKQMQKAGYGKSEKADELMEEILEQARKKEEHDAKENDGGEVIYQPQTSKSFKDRLWKGTGKKK